MTSLAHLKRTLSLVLIEDAPEAHLVIERCRESRSTAVPALQFAAPSLGFLEEEISLRYGLTADLTFAATAASAPVFDAGQTPRNRRSPLRLLD